MYRPHLFGGGKKALLDSLSRQPALVFSFRRLRAAQSGPCFRLRRSSDNAETDIGYLGDYVDVAAIEAHIGASDGFMVAWYDQMTANGQRAIRNITTTAQPRVALAGVRDTLDTLQTARPLGPARLNFSGSPVNYTAPTSGPTHLFSVHQAATTDSARFWMGTGGDNGTTNGLREIRNGYFEGGSTPTASVAPVINGRYLQEGSWAAFGTGVTAEFRRNGAAPVQVSTNIVSPLGAATHLYSRAGASADGGWGFEHMWFDAALTQADRDAIEASVGAFYGITMA